MPRHFVFNLRGRDSRALAIPRFYEGYKHIGKRTSLSGLVGLLYGLSRRTLTTRILPKIARPKARESLSNQQRSAIASTVIRDRLGGLTCFSLNLIFFESKPTVSFNIIPQFKPKVKYILLSLNSRQHTHHASDPNPRQACQKTG